MRLKRDNSNIALPADPPPNKVTYIVLFGGDRMGFYGDEDLDFEELYKCFKERDIPLKDKEDGLVFLNWLLALGVLVPSVNRYIDSIRDLTIWRSYGPDEQVD